MALFEDGQAARALEWSERSLELYPDDPSSLINAACVRARSREYERALELLERVFWGEAGQERLDRSRSCSRRDVG